MMSSMVVVINVQNSHAIRPAFERFPTVTFGTA